MENITLKPESSYIAVCNGFFMHRYEEQKSTRNYGIYLTKRWKLSGRKDFLMKDPFYVQRWTTGNTFLTWTKRPGKPNVWKCFAYPKRNISSIFNFEKKWKKQKKTLLSQVSTRKGNYSYSVPINSKNSNIFYFSQTKLTCKMLVNKYFNILLLFVSVLTLQNALNKKHPKTYFSKHLNSICRDLLWFFCAAFEFIRSYIYF